MDAPMNENKILIVDGIALLLRAFFAQSYDARRMADGTPTMLCSICSMP